MTQNNPVPSSPQEWLEEIAEAFLDVSELIPLAPLLDKEIPLENLFHLAPRLCFKFRGIEPEPKQLQEVTKAVLSSYLTTQDNTPDIFSSPELSFAFCYLASHFVCDIIDDEMAYSLIEYVEEHLKELQWLCIDD